MINAQNIYITNLKDMYAFIFDGSKFITVNKDDVLKELINNHFDNIECLLEEYRDKLVPYTVLVLEKFIKMMNDDDIKFMDQEHKKLYHDYKISDLKLLIYNSKDKKANIVICNNNESIVE